MFVASLLLWGIGALWGVSSSTPTFLSALGINFASDVVARLFSFLSLVAVALLLNHLYLFERRIHWLSSVFLWLSSVMMFVHVDYLSCFSSLLLMMAMSQLLSCVHESGQERALFGAFAFLSFSSLFLLQFAYVLPLFVAYIFIARISNVRNVLSALLGVVTPYWLLFGLVYAFPSLGPLLVPLKICYANMVSGAGLSLSPLLYLVLAVEGLIYVVAVCNFATSLFPAKPLLRRRLLFIIILNIYLFAISFFVPQDFVMLFVWRLPGVALLASYAFAMKITKLSNIYFITLNILWLATATLCLWIG